MKNIYYIDYQSLINGIIYAKQLSIKQIIIYEQFHLHIR